MFCPNCGMRVQGDRPTLCPYCKTVLSKSSSSIKPENVITQDWNLANQISDHIILGRAFAYVSRDIFDQPGLAWAKHFFGKGVLRSQVLSLLGPEPLILPAVSLQPIEIPKLRLSSITSDKSLYREKKDDVHLLILDPINPDTDTNIEVRLNKSEFSRHTIHFSPAGAATLLLKDLPSGSYEVKFCNTSSKEPACSFTVAEYRLAPLVASLTDRRLDGDKLAVKVRLEAFGASVSGQVQLELMDKGRRLAINKAEAIEGNVETIFTLSGEGPHSINIQLTNDPSRTATVPIVGSRADERKQTKFSSLGINVFGSLMPSESSREVRGIFLEDATIATSPFRLEKVDSSRAKLTVGANIETARIIVIDHTFPSARSGAVIPNDSDSPANYDEIYRFGEKLFNDGKYAQARVVFEEKRATLSSPHPNYAYYIACCYAREGERKKAVSALRLAIEDGWTDFVHMMNDEDFLSLQDYPPYEMLRSRGRKEFSYEMLTLGQTIEIDVPSPISVLAVGAYLEGKPWEGWAAIVSPSEIIPTIKLPEVCKPSSEIKIEVDLGQYKDASLYLIVKDARLLSSDTPKSRLAGQIKELAEESSKRLMFGSPEDKLRNYISQPIPPPMPMSMPMPTAARSLSAGSIGLPAPPSMIPVLSAASAPISVSEMAFYEAESIPMSTAKTGALQKKAINAPGSVLKDQTNQTEGGGGKAATTKPTTVEDPEVLFADLVEIKNGVGSITIHLGDAFADYIVEAFAISGLDWASTEKRFRAEKEVFAVLDMPLFVHPSDTAIGRVHLGSTSGQIQVAVNRDGEPIQLIYDGRSLEQKELINSSRAEVSFLAVAGDYEVMVEDPINKRVDYVSKRINIPGKFKYLSKALCFVREGEQISLEPNSDVVALRVMPSLDKPFKALVDATSSYGHACCEQTAAIMLSACAMYSFAGNNINSRNKAEGIIIAGVRREKSMWLKGRGFKMYPESANTPHDYYGPKAARYLWNLSLLKEMRPSQALARAIEEGLEMAKDASSAYKLDWPPKNPNTCEEAYAAVRFGNGAREQALQIARKYADNSKSQLAPILNDHYYGGAVGRRAEASFAAATLFRAGAGSDYTSALSLTNKVVKDLGENGRLYSTIDSVAAIALMSELQAAKVVTGGGKLEINGKRVSMAEALAVTEKVESITVKEGVIPIEITRVIEEDWTSLNSSLQVKVSIEKDGRVQRQTTVGEALNLKIKLDSGYKVGDLLWVCLPEALSRVIGGGQVKKFSIDFEGKDEIIVPLAATSITINREGAISPQHFAICVRNMFEEERGASPGLLEITVTPSGGGNSSILGRALVAFKNLFN